MTATIALVLWFPSTSSDSKSPKKSRIKQATEAGNETPTASKKTLTPKQAASMTMMPAGT